METTGLADPAPVAQTFFIDEDVGAAARRLDAVVTVADAKWLADRLKDAPEAKNQIAFADVILLNKADLVEPADLDRVEGLIRSINPYAKVHRTSRCDVALDQVLDRNAFDLSRILDIEPDFLEEGHHHHHDDEMQSVSARIDGPVDPEKFMPWISTLTQVQGPDILRCKGIVAFPNEPQRFVFQGVHQILDGDLQGPWKEDEARGSPASSSSAASSTLRRSAKDSTTARRPDGLCPESNRSGAGALSARLPPSGCPDDLAARLRVPPRADGGGPPRERRVLHVGASEVHDGSRETFWRPLQAAAEIRGRGLRQAVPRRLSRYRPGLLPLQEHEPLRSRRHIDEAALTESARSRRDTLTSRPSETAMISRLALRAALLLAASLTLGGEAMAGPVQDYEFRPRSVRNACRPPLKFAAGACVRRCPAGYRDNGPTCGFKSMRR